MNRRKRPTLPDTFEDDATEVDTSSYLRPRFLILVGVGLLLAILAVIPVAALLFGYFETLGRPPESITQGIRMDATDAVDLQNLRATEQARVSQFGWVNREAEIARIPVDEAMKVIAEGGQPFGGLTLPEGPEVSPGEALFVELGCVGCHQEENTPTAPTLVGIFGTEVPLEGGETVVADEGYLRDSILNPHAQVVAGYPPIMPSYQGRVNDQQLNDLIEYIRSLGQPTE
jgi:cytochrome c2